MGLTIAVVGFTIWPDVTSTQLLNQNQTYGTECWWVPYTVLTNTCCIVLP